MAGLAVVLTLAGVNGWQGWQAETLRRTAEQRELFLAAGRQGAINLTTIDFAQAEADVDRILGSATGAFRDDFSARSQPFVEVVKQARSKSVGTVTEAGVESVTGDSAKVLVAVAVNTSMAGTPGEQSRAWRMRVSVQKVGNDLKVANVEFVP